MAKVKLKRTRTVLLKLSDKEKSMLDELAISRDQTRIGVLRTLLKDAHTKNSANTGGQ